MLVKLMCIVALVRSIRPHVVVTFGPEGLYGHLDHLAISQFTGTALLCSADPDYFYVTHFVPHIVSKSYYQWENS
jgi:LmbE family N-acetylglucosaminyl deacetylase